MISVGKVWSALETAIGHCALGEAAFEPSDSARGKVIELRNARLDIHERRAVKHIHVRDKQPRSFHAQQPHRRHSDSVGPCRRTRGKDSMLGGIEIGTNHKLRLRSAVEQINQPEAIEAINVSEPRFILREQLNGSLGPDGIAL